MEFAINGRLGDVPPLPPLDGLRKQLAEISPELARARAETVRAERQLELERAQRWPNLALKAAMNEDPDIRASQIGVVMTIPLWDRRSGPVGEAAAQLSRARNELAAQEFSLAQALEVAFQQYEIAQTQVTALESGIVRQAEAALKVAEAAYRHGERGFVSELVRNPLIIGTASGLLANLAGFQIPVWIEPAVSRMGAASLALGDAAPMKDIMTADHSMRASKLIGMAVYNDAGEKVGSVIEVLVKPGDLIARDDNLLTLETGKVALDIPSPHTGRVLALHVTEGDTVDEGAPLVTLEVP